MGIGSLCSEEREAQSKVISRNSSYLSGDLQK